MRPSPVPFGKYEESGAYHWAECDRASSRYNPPLEARYEVVRNRVPPGSVVLDLGCGDGYLMGLVSLRCKQVVGVEAEQRAVELATEKLGGRSNCLPLTASCYELPFPRRAFDVVLMADVIEHLENPDACLKEVARVLTDSGTLLLTTPKWRPDRVWDPRHVREYRPEELADCLARHFERTTLSFFWPLRWSNLYNTRFGWRAIRLFARHFFNPFLGEAAEPGDFGQILAVCEGPR